jgi:hypothetical protein
MTTFTAKFDKLGSVFAAAKAFKTGSHGYYGQTKLVGTVAPDAQTVTVTDESGALVFQGIAVYRQFTSGNWGYYAQGKGSAGGAPVQVAVQAVAVKGIDPRAVAVAVYQAQVTMTVIGSKAKASA